MKLYKNLYLIESSKDFETILDKESHFFFCLLDERENFGPIIDVNSSYSPYEGVTTYELFSQVGILNTEKVTGDFFEQSFNSRRFITEDRDTLLEKVSQIFEGKY